MRLAFTLLPVLAISLATATAHADDDAPPPAPMPGPVPLYVAPLSQTTQTTYVPQSVALSGPDEIDAEEGRRAPTGYTPVQRTRKGMLIGGAITLGVSYGYAALFAAAGEDESHYDNYDGTSSGNKLASLWIPVAGPFLQMANSDGATEKVLLAGLGSAEVIGAVMLYYGLTTKKTVYVRNDLIGSMTITPMAGTATGMAVSGRF